MKKTAEEIWEEKQPERYGCGAYILPDDWQLEAMEEHTARHTAPLIEALEELLSLTKYKKFENWPQYKQAKTALLNAKQ